MKSTGRSSARFCADFRVSRFLQLVIALTSFCWVSGLQCVAESVRGSVTGPRGVVSAGEVHLLSEATVVRSTTVDAAGRFEFRDVGPGTYQIQIASPHLLPLVQEIRVSPGQDLDHDVT